MIKRFSAACVSTALLLGLSVPALASGSVDMRIVFGAPGAAQPSPEVVEQIIQPGQPEHSVEPGLPVEPVSPGEPGAGNEDPPVTAPEPHLVSSVIERETGSCGGGFVGQQERTRAADTYSDGSVVRAEWSAWGRTLCVAEAAPMGQMLEYKRTPCAAGWTAAAPVYSYTTQTVTFSVNGSVTRGAPSPVTPCTKFQPTVQQIIVNFDCPGVPGGFSVVVQRWRTATNQIQDGYSSIMRSCR